MSAEFDEGYQQQNFNQEFSASFNHDLFSSNSVSIIKHEKFPKVFAGESIRKDVQFTAERAFKR